MLFDVTGFDWKLITVYPHWKTTNWYKYKMKQINIINK